MGSRISREGTFRAVGQAVVLQRQMLLLELSQIKEYTDDNKSEEIGNIRQDILKSHVLGSNVASHNKIDETTARNSRFHHSQPSGSKGNPYGNTID